MTCILQSKLDTGEEVEASQSRESMTFLENNNKVHNFFMCI